MAERQSINPDCSLEKAHKDMPFNFKTNRWINLFKVFLFLKLIVGSTFSKFFSFKKLPFCRVDLLSPSGRVTRRQAANAVPCAVNPSLELQEKVRDEEFYKIAEEITWSNNIGRVFS